MEILLDIDDSIVIVITQKQQRDGKVGKLTAQQIADYFLSLVDEDCGDSLSNLKLQKLLYYAQGFHLAMYGEPLFDDPIEAWRYGPVVVDIYHNYKANDNKPLPVPENIDLSLYSKKVKHLLNDVYEIYGQFSALKLANLTHEEAPWKSTDLNSIISHEEMEKYFKTLLTADNG
ncbi:MAG: DUF4065 domain-containing protein [Phycisphaerae bacterium]|nr:DUF4065 domain-containing protein [Phycisphaerae bacterium]